MKNTDDSGQQTNQKSQKSQEKQLPLIMGFNKTSEAGFNVFAPSIFLFGCNLRCPYCMNGRIVVVKPEDHDRPVKTVPLDRVKQYVKENNSGWVMISGGEPTLTPSAKLHNLLDEIISWGCKIGMSSNGTLPEVLESILPKLNYVAMDLKTDNDQIYKDLEVRKKHKDSVVNNVLRSKALLDKNKKEREDFDFEVRTTIYPEYFSFDTIKNFSKFVDIGDTWVLQQFRHAKNMLYQKEAESVTPYSHEDMENMLIEAKKICPNTYLRYV